MNIDNLSLQSLGKFSRGVGVSELRDALEGRSSVSNPALVTPRPKSANAFGRRTPENGGSVHHSLSVRSAGSRRAVSATTRRKKVPAVPKDVKDTLDRLGIGSPKLNGSRLKTLSKLSSTKPELPCVSILFVFIWGVNQGASFSRIPVPPPQL